AADSTPVILIAHSLGCITVAHWAATAPVQYLRQVRGALLVAGADAVKIHGAYVPVRATVRQISNLSAHADGDELMAWMAPLRQAPRHTFITHGEPDAAEALRRRVGEQLGWECSVPAYGDEVTLT
ncbi:MAG: MBL fold metallo-hydrolase RNA specificity domain-containing protein, partial [Janthinobacterium sp.]